MEDRAMAKQITWDYELAMAAGKDAANARMRKAGRTAWNRADYNESVRVFYRLYGNAYVTAIGFPEHRNGKA
jgi:hypothetical protein